MRRCQVDYMIQKLTERLELHRNVSVIDKSAVKSPRMEQTHLKSLRRGTGDGDSAELYGALTLNC